MPRLDWKVDTVRRATTSHESAQIKKLVTGAQMADTESLAALYEQFYDRIFRYLSFKTGNVIDAEDLCEEVFLRMLESISAFKWKGVPFSSWLFRIAHNLIVDYFRKKGRKKQKPLQDAERTIDTASKDIDQEIDNKLSIQVVHKAMNELTKLQREVISLRFAGELSIAETAIAIGKKENAVKALQHAGIRNLRRTLNVKNCNLATKKMTASSGESSDE